MLLFPSTFTLTVELSPPVTGTAASCEPSLGTSDAIVYGNVNPPSVDKRIFTVAVFTTPPSVPATSHVIV